MVKNALSSLLRKIVGTAYFLFLSIWFSKDETMESSTGWASWARKSLEELWGKVEAVFRRNKGPMMRTAAKKRWLEDARGGVIAMMNTGFGQCGKPPSEGGDLSRDHENETVMSMGKFATGGQRLTRNWSRSGDRRTELTRGEEEHGIELTWSCWRQIRSTRFEGDLNNIDNINFDIRKRIYLTNNWLSGWDGDNSQDPNLAVQTLTPWIILMKPIGFPSWGRSLGGTLNLFEYYNNLCIQKTFKGWLVDSLQRIRLDQGLSEASFLSSCLAPRTEIAEQRQIETMAEQNICQDQIVEFSTDDVAVSMQRAKMSLLGRLFIENRPSLAVIHKIVTGAWECRKKVQVMEAEMGLLQFLFDDTEDMEWVLKRTPWPVKDRVLHLQRWSPVSEEVFDSLGFVPFSVQMWGIPSHCRTIAFGRRVAESKLGEVLDVGLFGIKGESDQFLKARVKINVLQPLRSQIWASNEVAGKFWVTFAYEFLPLFCFHCGRLGHMERNCVLPDPSGEERFSQEMVTTEVGFRLKEDTLKPAQFNPPPLPQSVWVNPKTKGKVAVGSATDRGDKRMSESKSLGREVVLALPAEGDRVGKGGQGVWSREGNRQGGVGGSQKGGRGARVEEREPMEPRSKKQREAVGRGAGERGNQLVEGGGRPEVGLMGRGDGGKSGGQGGLKKEGGVLAGRGAIREKEKGLGKRGKLETEGQGAAGLPDGGSKGKEKKGDSPKSPLVGAGDAGEAVAQVGLQSEKVDKNEVVAGVVEEGEKPEVLDAEPKVTDEYGTNFPKLSEVFRMAIAEDELVERKRSVEMVEDLAQDPTPTKKLCAENPNKEDKEMVEVASPKWPQLDK
ncbi:unnamed protein product [Linum trigynum]|uniref:CCHC-type domain-containing protein n=1 Tax=Linum trigynum TaxID=586398 RepID=A0AAV2EBS3_9ROSI